MFDSYREPDPNQPRQTDEDKARFYPKNLVGRSILIWVNDHLQEVPGAANPDSPDGLDVTVVDLGAWGDAGNDWGHVGVNLIWQANSLIGKLKDRVGNPNPIVVYLGKGQPAQKGWQAPFTLTDVSSDPLTRQKAEMWMQQNPGFVPNARQLRPASQPGQPGSSPTPGSYAGSTHQGYSAPAPAGPPQPGPIGSAPPYPMPPQPQQPGWTPTLSSAPPNGGHGHPHPAPVPGSGAGQPGWTGSPGEQPGYPGNSQQLQSQLSTPSIAQPELAYPETTQSAPPSRPEGVTRLERAMEPGRNAILDSLREKHGIPGPQQDNPPF